MCKHTAAATLLARRDVGQQSRVGRRVSRCIGKIRHFPASYLLLPEAELTSSLATLSIRYLRISK